MWLSDPAVVRTNSGTKACVYILHVLVVTEALLGMDFPIMYSGAYMNASCSTRTLVIQTSAATILTDTQGCSSVAFAHQGGIDHLILFYEYFFKALQK